MLNKKIAKEKTYLFLNPTLACLEIRSQAWDYEIFGGIHLPNELPCYRCNIRLILIVPCNVLGMVFSFGRASFKVEMASCKLLAETYSVVTNASLDDL